MRSKPVELGSLASREARDNESWAEESYAYGPLTIGLTAAAANEAVQHCEDLFALLKFLREPSFFAKKMAKYSAGKVSEFGRNLEEADDLEISRMFLVPKPETIKAGLAKADDPTKSVQMAEEGRSLLARLVRETAAFYRSHEHLHVEYKHGLKIPMRPFGAPTTEAIEELKTNVSTSVFTYTNESIQEMLTRPPTERLMMMPLGPTQQANVSSLVEERNLLRLRMLTNVDIDDLVERSYTVLQLLRIAESNRLDLGQVEDGNQRCHLPGSERWQRITILYETPSPLTLHDFQN